MGPEEKRFTGIQSPLVLALFGTAAFFVVLLGLKATSDIFAPIFLASVLAILFTPALRWLERRGLPTALALVVFALILIASFACVILVLLLSLSQFQARLPIYEALILQRASTLETVLAGKGIYIKEGLNTDILSGTAIIKTAIGTVTGVLTNIVGLVFFLFLLFLMLASSKDLSRKVHGRQSRGNAFATRFAAYARQIQKQYSIQTLSNFLSALAITIELFLFRVDFALLWGFLAFVLGFIPNVGLIIATLPAVIIALILYGWGTALAIVLIGILLNAIMDNLVTPRFMGKGLNLPMLSIFLSFLIWSWVFGFLGALLAVPATLLLRMLFQSRKETQMLAIFFEKETSDADPDPV
ncbi:MAG TPA: AI-2E family transporter [Ktedonobacteraceae bacterium]|jgi:predicted PurR-regulated permease PerM|nr:AI-2E family transporter [Ktedonobacteraceae bacterium]